MLDMDFVLLGNRRLHAWLSFSGSIRGRAFALPSLVMFCGGVDPIVLDSRGRLRATS